jgi:hypothetical protein
MNLKYKRGEKKSTKKVGLLLSPTSPSGINALNPANSSHSMSRSSVTRVI